MGGLCGLLVRYASEFVPDPLLCVLYALTAGAVGGTGIWLSESSPQPTSAQLFVITFVLVFAEGTSMVRV